MIFRNRADRRLIVGETKSRHYKGSVSLYECYQVTLYLGIVQRTYRRPATASLLLGNGRRDPVAFDQATHQHLLALLPDCRNTTRRR